MFFTSCDSRYILPIFGWLIKQVTTCKGGWVGWAGISQIGSLKFKPPAFFLALARHTGLAVYLSCVVCGLLYWSVVFLPCLHPKVAAAGSLKKYITNSQLTYEEKLEKKH